MPYNILSALDAPPVYHYYQTTRFTVQKEWPHKQTDLVDGKSSPYHPVATNHPVTAAPLPQPAAFYIAPMAVSIFKPQVAQAPPTSAPQTPSTLRPLVLLPTPKPSIFLKPPLATTIFPNKLPADMEESGSSNIPPLNPAPMLKPNPFINHQGQQIQFSTKSGGGVGVGGSVSSSSISKFKGPHRREEGSFCRRSFDGRSGYCILAYQCLHVIREYRVHGTKIDICTYRKNIPVICCPLADKHIDDQRISAQSK